MEVVLQLLPMWQATFVGGGVQSFGRQDILLHDAVMYNTRYKCLVDDVSQDVPQNVTQTSYPVTQIPCCSNNLWPKCLSPKRLVDQMSLDFGGHPVLSFIAASIMFS